MQTPTQVEHPWRAALRTGTQTTLAALAVAVIAIPILNDFIQQFWPDSPVVAWLAGAVLFAGGISTLITRLMAIPALNELLTRIGLGPAPKD